MPPNWVFDGLTSSQYLKQVITWAERGVQIIGGCCGTGPAHIQALAERFPRHGTPPSQAT
jgi:S-methylmethionine-dependent homocysteine/selenocysteine methylase